MIKFLLGPGGLEFLFWICVSSFCYLDGAVWNCFGVFPLVCVTLMGRFGFCVWVSFLFCFPRSASDSFSSVCLECFLELVLQFFPRVFSKCVSLFFFRVFSEESRVVFRPGLAALRMPGARGQRLGARGGATGLGP